MLLDILFPRFCIGCRKFGQSLCPKCRKFLKPIIQTICPYCFKTSPKGKTHIRCEQKYGLDGATAVILYNNIGKKIVKHIKYNLAYSVFEELSQKIPEHWWQTEEYLSEIGKDIFLQPIPLHPRREKKRGFNQSLIIARFLSNKLSFPIIDVLDRVKDTCPQARLSRRSERVLNIQNAFIVKNNAFVLNKTILLVDDLFTSGSTAKEAAKVLKKNGAEKVFLYTLAHGS